MSEKGVIANELAQTLTLFAEPMKKKRQQRITFKKPKFFRDGTLVFEVSGHKLLISDKHYRCALNWKGKCSANGEKQIKKETLDRAFSRYAQKFAIEESVGKRFLNRLMRDNLCDILFGTEEESELEQSVIDTTRAAMIQDVAEKKKVKPSDIKAIEDAFVKQEQAEYPLMLLGVALNLISAFINPHKEAFIGQNLAYVSKKIYLSNDGKIQKIELEKWGWYVLNLIDKQSPSYLRNLREKKIIITNKPDELTGLTFPEAAMNFGIGNSGKAMGQDATMIYGLFKVMRDSLGNTLEGDPEKMMQGNALMYNYFVNDPSFALLVKMVGAAGLEIKKE